jgi:hypothetical protein
MPVAEVAAVPLLGPTAALTESAATMTEATAVATTESTATAVTGTATESTAATHPSATHPSTTHPTAARRGCHAADQGERQDGDTAERGETAACGTQPEN